MQQDRKQKEPQLTTVRATRILIMPVLGIVFGGIYWQFFIRERLPSPYVLQTSPESVIGSHLRFRGQPKSPVTLVEFGDYFCSACRSQDAKVASLLVRYPGRLRFTFRNLPLQANSTAPLLAESAGRQGYFWQMHDYLFQSPRPVSMQDVEPLLTSWHLDIKRFEKDCSSSAQSDVQEDIAAATQFKLSYTPTFLLCLPDNRVLWLYSIDQAENYLGPKANG